MTENLNNFLENYQGIQFRPEGTEKNGGSITIFEQQYYSNFSVTDFTRHQSSYSTAGSLGSSLRSLRETVLIGIFDFLQNNLRISA